MEERANTMPGRNGGTLNVGGNHGGGRPAKLPELTEIIAKILSEEKGGMQAAEAIILAHVSKAVKGDVRSANFVFGYAYGQPKQQYQIDGNLSTTPAIDPAKLTTEELRTLLALLDKGAANTENGE